MKNGLHLPPWAVAALLSLFLAAAAASVNIVYRLAVVETEVRYVRQDVSRLVERLIPSRPALALD